MNGATAYFPTYGSTQMSSERQIDQKFDGPWRLIIAGYSVPMVVLFLHALVSRKMTAVGVTLAAYIILYLIAKIIQRMSVQQKPTWFLTENGLKRVRPTGEPDAVFWSQIQSLKYMKYVGLFIRWNKTKSNRKGEVVSYEEDSSILSIDKDEANELFSLWHRTMPPHQDKVVQLKKAANRFDVLEGGKSIFAGCLGLLLFIAEICSKHWLMAILVGLASATALTLGIGAFKGKFKGKGSLTKNILIIFLGICLVCLLVVRFKK